MTIFRDKVSGKLRSAQGLRAAYPNVSPGPSWPDGFADVVDVNAQRPNDKPHHAIVETGVALVGTSWQMEYEHRPLDSAAYLMAHRNSLLDALAAARFEAETGGIIFGGAPVATDRETQSQLSGALLGMGRNAAREIAWKSNGVYTKLTKPAIEAMHDAVFDHVQACRAHEETLALALGAATTLAEIDAVDITVGWPT